jgi:ketosteroid isomerase-like protein
MPDCSDDTLERIKRGYRALGPGRHPDVECMFDDDDSAAEGARHDGGWAVREPYSLSTRMTAAREPVRSLFASLPANWELVGVDIEGWVLGSTRLVVQGHYRARPDSREGRRTTDRFPFVHIWSFKGSLVERIVSALDRIELRRRRAAA